MTKTAGGFGLQGVQQIPLDGVSMVYTWNNATAKDEFGGGVPQVKNGRVTLGEFRLCGRFFLNPKNHLNLKEVGVKEPVAMRKQTTFECKMTHLSGAVVKYLNNCCLDWNRGFYYPDIG